MAAYGSGSALRTLGGIAGAVLVAGLLPAVVAAPATAVPIAAAPAVDASVSSPTGRWIVQLAEPALARHPQARTAAGRLAPGSAAAAGYAAHLRDTQAAFTGRLRQVAPGASVQRSYHVAIDGMSVAMSSTDAAAVRRLPGVLAVTPDVPYQLDMFSTPAQIGAPALWDKLGSQANAGAGVKVAIIDSGIFVRRNADGSYGGNPCFDDAGYPAPPKGFPKGELRFTNRKVIVARSYFRPDDPPIAGEAQAIQGTNAASPHGTHVAGTVACDAGTHTTFQGADVALTGVAPKAYLMNYRVFYPSQSTEDFQKANAYVTELVAAIDDAVADGADVVSSSWGSTYQNTLAWADPMVQAAEAATDAGVTMVFAQGNAGPDEATGNLPAASDKVIAVGAVTKTATITPGDLAVTAPAPVPANLATLAVGPAQFGPPLPATIGPAEYVPAEAVATNGSALGCSLPGDASPYPDGALTGRIALVERGTCNFTEKVFNAQRAGAVAALVLNTAAGGDSLQSMGNGVHGADITIPSLFLRRTDGLALRAFAAAHPGAARIGFTLGAHPAANPGDVVAGFSSRGPTADKTLKPDLVAPGVDVLSSGFAGGAFPGPFTGFGTASGTSMATPHVAGAVALLKQLHPDWTPAQLKSALMNTATQDVFLDTNHTQRAGELDRGAGRIDLTKAGDPGLTLAPQSLSGGEVPAGTAVPFTVTATDVAVGGLWNVSTTLSANAAGNVTVSPATDSIVVRRGATARFTLTVTAAAGAAPASYTGEVTLTQQGVSRTLHLPLWLRVVPAQARKQVLLVDDDGSAAGLTDYAATYRGVLDRLGISYDYLDVGTARFADYNTLFAYRTVVVFTGRNASFAVSGFALADHDRLSEWLDGGGRLLAIGQNFAEASDDNTSFGSARLGRARLYNGYLGVSQESADLYGDAAPPAPSAAGEGIFAGQTLTLDASQDSVEGTAPIGNTDTFAATATMVRFFAPLGASVAPDVGVAFGRSSEPGLAESRQQFRYRSAVLGFGLEGIPDETARDALANRLLGWLADDVRVTGSNLAVTGRVVTVNATGTSSASGITAYRWDFGDGTAPVAERLSSHRYARAGTYTVTAELTDGLGHRAVLSRTVTVHYRRAAGHRGSPRAGAFGGSW